MLRRAAAAAALRRERNNSSQDELSLKRQRSDNGNNNSPDVISHMPQVTAADFSTIKHNNNNTPPMKDAERAEDYSSDSMYQMKNSFIFIFFFSFSIAKIEKRYFYLMFNNSINFLFLS